MEKLKKALQPKVVIPTVISVAILAGLLAFGNINEMIKAVQTFQPIYILWVVLLIVGYEIVRAVQWLFLLRQLHVNASREAKLFAYLSSEVTKSVPIGNYFQNYLLATSEGSDPGRTSAATTLQVLGEVAVSLTGLVILGLGAWSTYLRAVIIVGLLIFGFSVWAFMRLHNESGPPEWMTKRKALRQFLDEARKFREAAKDLIEPRTLIFVYVNSAIYCVIAGTTLYMTAKGMQIADVPYFGVLAVYFFSLAISLIFPLPTDIGTAEISGAGAFLLIGVSRAVAVSVMLIFRVLNILTALALAIIGGIVFHDVARDALQHRGQDGGQQNKQHREQASEGRAAAG